MGMATLEYKEMAFLGGIRMSSIIWPMTQELAFADFFSSGVVKNLGWVSDLVNAQIRSKLRHVFREWYDYSNNKNDKNCCILAIYRTIGTLIIDHGATFYYFDFENKTAT